MESANKQYSQMIIGYKLVYSPHYPISDIYNFALKNLSSIIPYPIST
jgi:hypothetical protein